MRLIQPLAALLLASTLACARAPEGLKSLDAASFQAALAQSGGVVLDVRTPAEHQAARIPTPQVLIPVQDLERRLAELRDAQHKPILIYCRSGNRSTTAGAILLKAGFTDVRHLEGGIGSWKAEGHAVAP